MQPIYFQNLEKIKERIKLFKEKNECTLCGRNCKIDRNYEKGICNIGNKIKIARFAPYFNEEPPISGKNGAGNIFFSNCNLKCVYCQNYEISHNGAGVFISEEELADIFLILQEKKAENINLVSPTPYIPMIMDALIKAIEKGFSLPIIANTNAYMSEETLNDLFLFTDIFLPDYKYADNNLASKYSKVNNYHDVVFGNLEKMIYNNGVEIIENGIMKRGVIIRHLVLPSHIENSKKVLKNIRETFGKYVYVSLMAQYTPVYKAKEYPEIDRALNQEEYDEIENYFFELGFVNGWVQSLDSATDKYIPFFTSEKTQLFSKNSYKRLGERC